MKICSPEGEPLVDPVTLRVVSSDLVFDLQRYVCLLVFSSSMICLVKYLFTTLISNFVVRSCCRVRYESSLKLYEWFHFYLLLNLLYFGNKCGFVTDKTSKLRLLLKLRSTQFRREETTGLGKLNRMDFPPEAPVRLWPWSDMPSYPAIDTVDVSSPKI